MLGAAKAAIWPALTGAEILALKQEKSRFWLATMLIALLAAIVLVALLAFAIAGESDMLTEAVKLTFGPVAALIGTVVGFYFGTKKDEGG